jgi:hypothetical protein
LENILASLYALQQVDSKLEEIHELKGDLPGIVADLKVQSIDISAKLKSLNELVKTLKIARDNADVEIITATEKIEKFKNQQLQVKSNKQYDALAKEIDSADAKISEMEREMESAEGKIQGAKLDSEMLSKRLEEITVELEEKEKELREVSKEHEKEESKLQQQRKKIASGIAKSDIEKYERIRKAKGGKAIVAVKRNACGGCYNKIPPQKILELRQINKLFICEQCGRIIVSDEIVARHAAVS